MAKAFTRQQRFARRLDDIHAEFVTEGGCGFEAFQQDYRGGSTGELTDAAREIYQAALAAAPTHVPPPRTAVLEHCEVEIYEGLTYVRLDDVMHLLSEGAPSEQQVERAAKAMQNESGGFFSLESWRHLARVALTAAGVAPQEPNQNETKSGNNFVSLDRTP